MLYEYKNEVYVLANSKFYKLKLDKGNLAITGEVTHTIGKERILVTPDRAKEILGGKSSKETPKTKLEEY